jgi:hypothetical protein
MWPKCCVAGCSRPLPDRRSLTLIGVRCRLLANTLTLGAISAHRTTPVALDAARATRQASSLLLANALTLGAISAHRTTPVALDAARDTRQACILMPLVYGFDFRGSLSTVFGGVVRMLGSLIEVVGLVTIVLSTRRLHEGGFESGISVFVRRLRWSCNARLLQSNELRRWWRIKPRYWPHAS